MLRRTGADCAPSSAASALSSVPMPALWYSLHLSRRGLGAGESLYYRGASEHRRRPGEIVVGVSCGKMRVESMPLEHGDGRVTETHTEMRHRSGTPRTARKKPKVGGS